MEFMLEKLKNSGLQKIMNTLNQFNKISDDWGKSEELYSRIYMEHTIAELKENFGDGVSLRVLDGGCGTGPMAIELAKLGHFVTGIEIHKPSLEEAKRKAAEAGVTVDWISGDLYGSLRKLEAESFDVVLCFGVLYTCTEYKEIVGEYSRLLKPAGMLFASFRSKFYFITSLLRQKQYEKALFIISHSEGALKLASVQAYYNWQSGSELRTLYGDSNLEVKRLLPVGVFSGAGYDGMAAVADVEQMPADIVHTVLYELETSNLDECLGAGRFMFAIGRKTEAV